MVSGDVAGGDGGRTMMMVRVMTVMNRMMIMAVAMV